MNTAKVDKARALSNIIIRPFTVADIDFVISRQLELYKREYGFTSETWNAYLAGGVRDFVNRFDDKKDCMYILENNGATSGCVAITHADEVTA